MDELEQLRTENEALKQRNAELVATSEVMKDYLVDSTAQMGAIIRLSRDKVAISLTEIESVISANMIALKLTPAQCLNQIKADAVKDAIDYCEESVTIIADMQRERYETISVCTVDELKQYAARLRKDATQ